MLPPQSCLRLDGAKRTIFSLKLNHVFSNENQRKAFYTEGGVETSEIFVYSPITRTIETVIFSV
jgi:hypothetical protein